MADAATGIAEYPLIAACERPVDARNQRIIPGANEVKTAIRRLWIAALLLALTTMMAGCGGKEERKAMHMEKGKEYYARANYDDAKLDFPRIEEAIGINWNIGQI